MAGSKVVSPMHRPRSAPQKHYFMFLVLISVRDSEPQGLVRLEGLGKLKTFIHLIRYQTRDLLACSIVPYLLGHFLFYKQLTQPYNILLSTAGGGPDMSLVAAQCKQPGHDCFLMHH
jgi:hypothetical protein